jgi:hypothetical protein
MYQSLIVVDDFYPDPHKVRKTALSFDYPEVAGRRTYPGRNSRQHLLLPGTDRIMSQILAQPVVGAAHPPGTHGRFRITLAGEEGRYLVHVDPTAAQWVGVVYLNPPEQCRGGTAFFRHEVLDSDRTRSLRPSCTPTARATSANSWARTATTRTSGSTS